MPFDKIRTRFEAAGALAYVVKPINQYSFQPAPGIDSPAFSLNSPKSRQYEPLMARLFA
jgi:hypothetical protein